MDNLHGHKEPPPLPPLPPMEPEDEGLPDLPGENITEARTSQVAAPLLDTSEPLPDSEHMDMLLGLTPMRDVQTASLQAGIKDKAVFDVTHTHVHPSTTPALPKLQDHPQPPGLESINNYKKLWKDPNIAALDQQSAMNVQQTIHYSRQSYLGQYLLAIDPATPDVLTIIVQEAKAGGGIDQVPYAVPISADGRLQWDGRTFENPQQLVTAMSNQNQLVMLRTEFISKFSTLEQYMRGVPLDHLDVDSSVGTVVKLLIHNKQYESAFHLLEHVQKRDRSAFQHVLQETIPELLHGDHTEILSHCLTTFANSLPDFPSSLRSSELADASPEALHKISDHLEKQFTENNFITYATNLGNAGKIEPLRDLLFRFSDAAEKMPDASKLKIAALVLSHSPKNLEFCCNSMNMEPTPEQLLTSSMDNNKAYGIEEYHSVLPVLNYLYDNGLTITPGILNELLINALRQPKEFKTLLALYRDMPLQQDLLKKMIGYGYDQNLLKSLMERCTAVTPELFKNLNYRNPSTLNDVHFLLPLIKDGAIVSDCLLLFVEENANTLVKFCFTQFPELANDPVPMLKCVEMASKEGNLSLLNEVLLPALSKIDPELMKPDVVRLFLGPLATASFHFTDRTDLSAIEKAVDGHYDKFPNLNELFLKWSWIPKSEIAKIRAACKSDPSFAPSVMMLFAQNGSGVKVTEEVIALMKEVAPHTPNLTTVIQTCIENGNGSFLTLLTQSGIKIDPASCELLFKAAIQSNFSSFVHFIADQNLMGVTVDGKSLLQYSVESNRPDFVTALIAKNPGMPIPESITEEALYAGYLSVVRALGSDDALKEAAQTLLQSTPKEVKQTFIQLFLNSHSQDVELMLAEVDKALSSLENSSPELSRAVEEAKDFIHNEGRLIARFPRPDEQREMHQQYGQKYSTYSEQQQDYGQKRYEVYKNALAGFKNENWSVVRLYEELSGIRNPSIGIYQAPPWRLGIAKAGVSSYTTPISGRYTIFKRVAKQFENKVSTTSAPHQAELGINGADFTIKHRRVNRDEVVRTTMVNLTMGIKPEWAHSHPDAVKILLEDMGIVMEQIRHYPLPADAKKVPEELSKLIAHFYWMGCHAMPTARNNSQYALEMHTMLYEAIGFRTGALSQEFVLPDCVALCTDFESFYNDYYKTRLFDHPPQKIA